VSTWRSRVGRDEDFSSLSSTARAFIFAGLQSATKESWPDIAPTGIWLLVAVVSSLVLALVHSALAPLPGVVTVLLVPGAFVMSLLKTRPANTAGRLVLAVCLSMMAIMVEGGVASFLGPIVGISQPLDTIPQSVIWFILAVVIMVIGALTRSDPIRWILEGVGTRQVAGVLASGLLVLVSLLGVARLNHTGNIDLAVFGTALDVVVLLAGVVGGWKRNSRWPLSTLLYSASLALLLSTSLRGGHLYGWDVQQEFGVAWHTLRAGVWRVPASHDPYASMLSLTVLPAVLHSLVKLRLLAFFQLVVPAILALLPVAVFSTVRSVPRWITSGRSAPRPGLALGVVAALVVSSVAYSSELVSITRQAMALTMLTALVMVMFDRAILKRPAQITVGLLLVGISFTHYTTSYLLAGILLCSWPVSLAWSQGWLGTPKAKIEKHRYDVRSRKIINGALVIVALVAAFGWNLGITRNSALTAPSSAVSSTGVGLGGSTTSAFLAPQQIEHLLESELKTTAKYLIPVKGSSAVRLVAATIPDSKGAAPAVGGTWNELSFLAVESLWIVLGIALIYGVFRLGRRRSFEYTADLVGLAVTGLAIGGFLRFAGTLASFYNPERAAIFTAILLAAPVTLYLDDLVIRLYYLHGPQSQRVLRTSLGAGFAFLVILVVHATGLGALLFGGETPPGSLSATNSNVVDFTVSTPELATAVWLHNNVPFPGIVQSDLYGHLVLLSEPGSYDLLDEIVPREVDKSAYVYLSAENLRGVSQAASENLTYFSAYRTTLSFFNEHYYVVYSTGATRVYH
jgi:uncharacterized membrane protein